MFCPECGRNIKPGTACCPYCQSQIASPEICTGFWDLLPGKEGSSRNPALKSDLNHSETAAHHKNEEPGYRIHAAENRIPANAESGSQKTVSKESYSRLKHMFQKTVRAAGIVLLLSLMLNLFFAYRSIAMNRRISDLEEKIEAVSGGISGSQADENGEPDSNRNPAGMPELSGKSSEDIQSQDGSLLPADSFFNGDFTPTSCDDYEILSPETGNSNRLKG